MDDVPVDKETPNSSPAKGVRIIGLCDLSVISL